MSDWKYASVALLRSNSGTGWGEYKRGEEGGYLGPRICGELVVKGLGGGEGEGDVGRRGEERLRGKGGGRGGHG